MNSVHIDILCQLKRVKIKKFESLKLPVLLEKGSKETNDVLGITLIEREGEREGRGGKEGREGGEGRRGGKEGREGGEGRRGKRESLCRKL